MTNSTPDPSGDTSHGEEQEQLIDSMTGTLDQWRSRIDELRVQADLAKLDARERATKQPETSRKTPVSLPTRSYGWPGKTLRKTLTPSRRACRGSSTT